MFVGLSHSIVLLAHRVCKEAKSVEIQSMLYFGHTISLTDRLLSAYYHSLMVIIQMTTEPSSTARAFWEQVEAISIVQFSHCFQVKSLMCKCGSVA